MKIMGRGDASAKCGCRDDVREVEGVAKICKNECYIIEKIIFLVYNLIKVEFYIIK